MHVNEVRRRKDHRGVNLISDALPFGQLWMTRQIMQSGTRCTIPLHMML
jgi:hypothetical protein